jgi:hypothetical protein
LIQISEFAFQVFIILLNIGIQVPFCDNNAIKPCVKPQMAALCLSANRSSFMNVDAYRWLMTAPQAPPLCMSFDARRRCSPSPQDQQARGAYPFLIQEISP